MTKEERKIEYVAKAIYNTHWSQTSPIWENASDNVKDWVCKQAKSAIEKCDNFEIEQPGS